MTTSRINAYRWPARLVSHKPFAAERYFITSSSIWQVFFAENYDFSFLFSSVLSMAAFSVQDAQSQRFLPVENSPVPLCNISMGGKCRLYLLYRRSPFRLLTAFAATFPKGTASVVTAKFPASPKGVPWGSWHRAAMTERVLPSPQRRRFRRKQALQLPFSSTTPPVKIRLAGASADAPAV